jgi:queuosine precursor transporter
MLRLYQYNGTIPPMSQALLQRLTHKHQSLRNFRYYDILVHIFVVVLLISNLVGSKICAIGPFRISGAQLLFPITYIFGDVFTEVYGYSGSRRAIWIGFFASGLMALMGLITVHIPPAPDWQNQHAFEVVFNFVPRMVAASLVAFWCGEFANSYTLARMKLLTEGRWLWTRTVGSTVVGQAVDTTIVMFLAFGGTLDTKLILNLIGSGYLGKVLYEVLATPGTYLVVNFLKRTEGVDVYDTHTDFNPFSKEKVGETDIANVSRDSQTSAVAGGN